MKRLQSEIDYFGPVLNLRGRLPVILLGVCYLCCRQDGGPAIINHLSVVIIQSETGATQLIGAVPGFPSRAL